MSALMQEIARLSREERQNLILEIQESLETDFADETERELLRNRVREASKNPLAGKSWEQVRSELEAQIEANL